MLVTTKQAYVFMKEGQEPFRLPLTDEPVPAPDWIKETALWSLALRDGTLGVYEAPSKGSPG